MFSVTKLVKYNLKDKLHVSFLFLRVYARREVIGPGSASPCIKLFL